MMGAKFAANGGPLTDQVWAPLAGLFSDLTYGLIGVANKTAPIEDQRISLGSTFKVRNGNGDNCIDGRTTCALRSMEILSWDEKT